MASLRSYQALTFDCYGTLVDWEGGIYTALKPITQQLATTHALYNDRLATLKAFVKLEGEVQSERPTALYKDILSEAFSRLAGQVGASTTAEEVAQFGLSVGQWPVFPDTVAALNRLQKYYKLVILSNVDRESFARTLAGPLNGVTFDGIYTAQEIGSYKPDLRNFQYLIDHVQSDLGVPKDRIIHTAQSLYHDSVPATKIGLTSAWIERGEDVESVMGGNLDDLKGQVSLTFRYKNMKAMADAADAESS